MKCNDSMIIYFFVFGILIGAVMYDIISSLKYKPDTRGKTSVKSVYDSRFKSFEYHGHRYLKYMDIVQAYSTTLHDPDCPCWTNRLESCR